MKTEEKKVLDQEPECSPDEANAAMEKAVSVMEAADDFSEKKFTFSSQIITFEKLLKDYRSGKLQIPSFQRMYVWPRSMRQDLLDTVKVGLPFGALCVGEVDNIRYLVDGRQRNTSLSLLLSDEKLLKKAEMDIKDIMNYPIVLITAHDMTYPDLLLWFRKLNSGMRLAPIVKSRSNLSTQLTEALLEIAQNPVIMEDETERLSTVFRKSHHHELIAMNALLAAAGIELADCRAKSLCQRLSENEEAVLAVKAEADALVGRLADIYVEVNPKYFKKSFIASCITPILYIMVQRPEVEAWQYAAMINHIFEGNKAIEEYAATTKNNGNDAINVRARMDLMLKLLDDDSIVPKEKPMPASEEETD